jgi:hypothetical protein
VETGHAQNRSHGRNIGDIAVLDKETTLLEKMLYTPHVVIQRAASHKAIDRVALLE